MLLGFLAILAVLVAVGIGVPLMMYGQAAPPECGTPAAAGDEWCSAFEEGRDQARAVRRGEVAYIDAKVYCLEEVALSEACTEGLAVGLEPDSE